MAIASMTVLTASGMGLVAAPMAFGQILFPIGLSSQDATVANSGSASANSGGNTAVGNGSSNTATSSSSGGGLINVPISVGAPTNTSDGAASVNTGPASAAGNSSGTGVGQSRASGDQVNSFLGAQSQSAGVSNAGSASADSGGNTAIGNASTNTATVNQGVSGGLLGVGVTLGGPTNNSTGSAAVNSGSANALGNSSSTDVGQAALRGAGHCGTGRFLSFQGADVSNQGQALANTGNNTAIGNASSNDASVTAAPQTVSGGLLGVGLTVGGPVNNSSGTAVIDTGPAGAVGNVSDTTVTQSEGCPQVTTVTGGRQAVVVPGGKVQHGASLARTGLDTGDLGMIAGALLGAGMLLIAGQRRRMAARRAPVPMAGFGAGVGANDWDRAVR